MYSANYKHTYTNSEDVVLTCNKRSGSRNIVNKDLITANISTDSQLSHTLQRHCIGGTTIIIQTKPIVIRPLTNKF